MFKEVVIEKLIVKLHINPKEEAKHPSLGLPKQQAFKNAVKE